MITLVVSSFLGSLLALKMPNCLQTVANHLLSCSETIKSASGDCLLSKAELVVLVARHTFYFEGEVPLLLGGLLDKLANACQLTALGLRGWNAWEHLSKKS